MKKCLLFIMLLCSVMTSNAENYPYRSDFLWLTQPDHADWLYKTGEKAKVEVGFYIYGVPQDIEVDYEIAPDMMPATAKGKMMLKNRHSGPQPSTMAASSISFGRDEA